MQYYQKKKNTNIINDNILSVLRDREVICFGDKGNRNNKDAKNNKAE